MPGRHAALFSRTKSRASIGAEDEPSEKERYLLPNWQRSEPKSARSSTSLDAVYLELAKRERAAGYAGQEFAFGGGEGQSGASKVNCKVKNPTGKKPACGAPG